VNAVAQKLHASISPKDQSPEIFRRCEIASNKALQNHTSTLDPTQQLTNSIQKFYEIGPKLWSVDPLF
jgi:hypothetical protein